MATMDKRLASLDNITKIQVSPGNGDANEYMRGMANGLILANAIMRDKEPVFLIGPTKQI